MSSPDFTKIPATTNVQQQIVLAQLALLRKLERNRRGNVAPIALAVLLGVGLILSLGATLALSIVAHLNALGM